MTHEEALILSAYTGVPLVNDFSEMLGYIEDLLGRPVFLHELAFRETREEIRKKLLPKISDMILHVSNEDQAGHIGNQTNADRIRNMSDESLADLFACDVEGIAPCTMFLSIPTGKMFISRDAARKDVEMWLKQPKEEA